MITATDGLTPSQRKCFLPSVEPSKEAERVGRPDQRRRVGGAAATRLCMSVRSTNELLQPRRACARSLAHPSIWVGPRPRATRPPRLLFLFPSHRFHCFPTARQSMPACLPAFLPSCQLLGVGWPMVEVACCHVRPVIPVPQPAPLRTPSRLCQAYNLEDTRYIYKDGRERERESAS